MVPDDLRTAGFMLAVRFFGENMKNKKNIIICIIIAVFILLAGAAYYIEEYTDLFGYDFDFEIPDYVKVDLIDIDGASRSGIKLDAVNSIVIHYVGNPGTSAQNNRDYFNNPDSEVSSHFVIGLEGEVILCVPLDEKSSASNHRNSDTISIEVCHPDETGKFNDKTYSSLVKLTAFLKDEYSLDIKEIIRHFDVTGKNCPKYFVENKDAWQKFLSDVENFEKND